MSFFKKSDENVNSYAKEVMDQAANTEKLKRYLNPDQYAALLHPTYMELLDHAKYISSLSKEKFQQAMKLADMKLPQDNQEIKSLLASKRSEIVANFKVIARDILKSKKSSEITKHDAYMMLYVLANDNIISDLSPIERIVIHGLCMESLTIEEQKSVADVFSYLDGVSEEQKRFNSMISIEDEYLIFSKYHKSVDRTVLVRDSSFLSLLCNMLPERMMNEIINHRKAKENLRTKQNAYGDYQQNIMRDSDEKDYIDLYLQYFIQTKLYKRNSDEVLNEYLQKNLSIGTVEGLRNKFSDIKKKYFNNNKLDQK